MDGRGETKSSRSDGGGAPSLQRDRTSKGEEQEEDRETVDLGSDSLEASPVTDQACGGHE
jgi:hypothetical protein